MRIRRRLPRPLRLWFWRKKLRQWRTFPGRMAHDLRWNACPTPRARKQLSEKVSAQPDTWCFVLGINNSGTTMLSSLLEQLPGIDALPAEGQQLSFALPRSGEFDVSRIWGNHLEYFRLTEDQDGTPAQRLKYDWSFHLPRRPRVAMVKGTQNSVRSVWIQRQFPDTRFIAIVRHPFAVCEGIHRRAGSSLVLAAQHWKAANEVLLNDLEKLQRSMLIRYEDLCEHPQQVLREMAEFLDLEANGLGHILDQPLHAPTETGKPMVITNQNHASIGRLSTEDKDLIARITGPVMQRLDYTSAGARE